MSDDERQQWLAVLSGLISLAVVTLAAVVQSNPDLPRELWYRWTLYQAYRERPLNFDRLRYMRRQVEAGMLRDDMEGSDGEPR